MRWMALDQARWITEIIQTNGLRSALEIGTFHGVGTCYMAAAMADGGRVTTIDVAEPEAPHVMELARRCGLDNINAIVDRLGAPWVMERMLGEDPALQFDFIYIDGNHTLPAIAADFLYADKLLAPGGWLVFDDLDWSYAISEDRTGESHQVDKPQSWREAAQVRLVIERFMLGNTAYERPTEKARAFACRKKSNDS